MKIVNFINSHFYFIVGSFITFLMGGLIIDTLIH